MMKNLPILVLLAGCATAPAAPPPSDLVVCGADEVFILDLRGAAPAKVWSWRAADRPELPEEFRKKFGAIDECKPVDGGRRILISSSGGAVALVERSTGKVLFHAAVPNAHSAELLPGNRVAAASSYKEEEGNRLLLYDLAVSDKPLASDEFYGAHGVVWDSERDLLWALGDNELRAYRVVQGRFVPKLVRALPNAGGHDLRPVPGTSALMVTTGQHVWLFDRDALTFRTHPRIGDQAHVKSVDLDLASGAMAYVQGESSWWAERVKFLGLDRTVVFPAGKLYKARWVNP